MAFQNEPTFMAACRLSSVFSSDGSISASRFMQPWRFRFICLLRAAYSCSRVSFCRSLRLRSFPERSTSEIKKGNLSYLALIQHCASV